MLPPVVLIARHSPDSTASLCRVKGQDVAQLHIIDSTVPLSYHGFMPHPWPENEVRKISRVWPDHDGRTWVVVFDLANLRGRIECVGVAVRSSLGAQFDGVNPVPESEINSPLWDWIDPVPDDAAGDVSLRPLLATTLRQLPFKDVLLRARRDHADELRLYAEDMRAYPTSWSDPEKFERLATSYEPPSKASGRQSKYSIGFLHRVASVYQAAFEDRMDPPAKRVERELGLTPDVARKLIHRCRGARFRLLPPAEGRRARGWRPGEREEKP